MAKREAELCINDVLRDDELRAILEKLQTDGDRSGFSLVCKRWLSVQSTGRRKLCVRAGPFMLRKMAFRFPGVLELDMSQSASRSFFPGVTNDDLAVIAQGFRCLQILALSNCKNITDVGLEQLGNGLPYLQSLDVSNCTKISDKGLSAIAKGCRHLKCFNLYNCKLVSDKLLEVLSRSCHHIEELVLHGCCKITDSGLAVLVEGCRQIKILDISKCNKVGDLGVSSVANACRGSLRTMKLLDCSKIADDSLFSLASSCDNLETLVITGCRNITDDSVRHLAITSNSSLRYLLMDWCPNISDSSLSYVFSCCVYLEELCIAYCDKITDDAFSVLSGRADYCLRILKAAGCSKVTVNGIRSLVDCCKSLNHLDVASCRHITKEACEQAGLQFPESCTVNFTSKGLVTLY
ncbi:unnamed protein product [Victoria cruziana]